MNVPNKWKRLKMSIFTSQIINYILFYIFKNKRYILIWTFVQCAFECTIHLCKVGNCERMCPDQSTHRQDQTRWTVSSFEVAETKFYTKWKSNWNFVIWLVNNYWYFNINFVCVYCRRDCQKMVRRSITALQLLMLK